MAEQVVGTHLGHIQGHAALSQNFMLSFTSISISNFFLWQIYLEFLLQVSFCIRSITIQTGWLRTRLSVLSRFEARGLSESEGSLGYIVRSRLACVLEQ